VTAAAVTNRDPGTLDARICDAIVRASREVRENQFDQHFVVDVIQGGAGTSTNDVYPTAVKIAAAGYVAGLVGAMERLRASFEAKGEEFASVLKMGRTQLQDAVPMTLGQEFDAYAVTLGEDIERLGEASRLMYEMNLGATAIGTGINTPPGYVDRVCSHLREVTGLPLVTSPNLVEATSDAAVFVQVSGLLKRIAVKLSKVCNDLRLLSSGPRTGPNEINLPAVQPGSTIMPGSSS